jgi:diketogulonate reductase-like aldo/keto reductase
MSNPLHSAPTPIPPIEISANGYCRIDNESYPAVGFGTYLLQGKVCETALEQALQTGYRIIDTATFYKNFEPISRVLKKHRRQDLYLISKVWHDSHAPAALREDLSRTLKELKTDYLDCYFLHWPNSTVSIKETLTTMDEFRREKRIHHIGLSNVTVNHLKRALEVNVPISWVQVEMHPLYYDPELLAFCKEHQIAVQAWSPLARGRIKDEPWLMEIAKKYGKTPAQIAIRWIIQNGVLPLPGSGSLQHITENSNVNDFLISDTDMQTINAKARSGQRARIVSDRGLGFTDEFDFTYEQCWPK